MLKFETVNELTLKSHAAEVMFYLQKQVLFIAGENTGAKDYTFEKFFSAHKTI